MQYVTDQLFVGSIAIGCSKRAVMPLLRMNYPFCYIHLSRNT